MEKKCPNCDFPILPEHKFCPSCSQRTSEKVTLRSLFANTIASYFSLDSRLFHTLLPLLIKPGKVAKDFIAGKRKTYLYPVQSYLFFSLVFLIIFELLTPKIPVSNGEGESLVNINTDSIIAEIDTSAFINQDSFLAELDTSNIVNAIDSLMIESDSSDFTQVINGFVGFGQKIDSLKKAGVSRNDATLIMTANDKWGIKFIKTQSIKIMYTEGHDFLSAALGNTPFTLLLFLPFLALFQYVFSNRKKWNVASHFVFHLYNLSFAFIVLLILFIIDYCSGKDSILLAFGIIPIYLFLSLLNFYGHKVWRTISRFLILSFFSAIIGFPIIAIGTMVLTFLRY